MKKVAVHLMILDSYFQVCEICFVVWQMARLDVFSADCMNGIDLHNLPKKSEVSLNAC